MMKAAAFASALALVSAACARAATPAAEIRFHADASLRANAVYHVACLAGSIACTTKVFEKFWTTRLQETPDDREAIARWKRALAGVVERAPAMGPVPILPNASPLHPGSHAKRAAIAGAFQARSADELRKRAPLLTEDEARQLIGAVEHVERRLRAWWDAEGEPSIRARAGRIEETARKNGMAQTMVQMTRFLKSAPPDRDIYLHLIAAPDPKSTEYAATAVANHLPLEAVDAAKNPDDLVHGAVHELTHYLYDYMPAEKHRALLAEFVASDAPSASGIYSYLHEAIAVSAQVVYRHALTGNKNADDSGDNTYHHPYIPALADAAAPLVEDAIAAGGHLDRGFVKPFLSRAATTLGTKLHEPRLVLGQMVLVSSPETQPLLDVYQSTMFPVTVGRYGDITKADAFPDSNVVQVATYAELDRAPVVDAKLKALRSARRGIAYASPRGRGGYFVTITGRDIDAINDVIQKLGELDRWSTGVLVTLGQPE